MTFSRALLLRGALVKVTKGMQYKLRGALVNREMITDW